MKKTLTLVTLLAASASQASGTAITSQSGRNTGMGSTGVASSRDSASIFYNPAGILGVNTLDLQLGDTLILVNLDFTPEGGEKESQFTLTPPPHAYFAYKFNEQVAAGVGVFTPHGSAIDWGDDFSGRFVMRKSSLATFDINPTVAFAPVKQVRLGFGMQAMYSTVNLQRHLDPLLLPDSTVELTGDAWGFGYNAGVQMDVVQNVLTLGAHFRSQVKLGFEGDADFRDVPPPANLLFADQGIKTTVRLPASLGLGVAVVPLPRLLVAVDANWVQWSNIRQILIEFEESSVLNQELTKDWRDEWNVHLGAEYGLTEALTVRAGFAYEPTPSPEETLTPDLPDADRVNVSLGAGYAITPSFRVDLGYEYLMFQEQRSTFPRLPGTYGGRPHLFSLTLGYSQ